MPNINSIPINYHSNLSPYHELEDNRPLKEIALQLQVINDQVDINNADMLNAIGDQGTLSNRLNQSLNPDGSLKSEAIDEALHSIAEHTETGTCVIMTTAERSKLALVSSNATSFAMLVETDNVGDVSFTNTTLTLTESDSIVWNYSGSKLSAEFDFPSAIRHTHYYNLTPTTTNYKNFTSTSLATPYKENTLRVFVNGVRLNQVKTVLVPFDSSGNVTWSSLKYTEGTAVSGTVVSGQFALNSTIPSSASIIIDFDVLY